MGKKSRASIGTAANGGPSHRRVATAASAAGFAAPVPAESRPANGVGPSGDDASDASDTNDDNGFAGSDQTEADENLPALSTAFRQRIRPVLNRIDQLRSHGLQSQLKLPMVAVVGDQSVGKSSVLEAISGIEFPRGTGIVTRCPLQLSMRNSGDGGTWRGVISYHTVDKESVTKELHNPADVDSAVREAQTRMTRHEGDISSEQISITVEGSDVPDLTLLDLPGIARYSSTEGSAIAQVTKTLISKYVCQPQVIILVVVPCHQDIETVEALSLAKEADPHGERTIGVMTCPDMVNRGAEHETMKIARNEKITLKKGYVMVKCRSPQELRDGVTLAESVGHEEMFFRTHKHFSELPERSVGVKNLAEKLTEELFLSIKKNISGMQKDILDLRKKYQDEMLTLGQPVADSMAEKRRHMFEMVSNYTKEVTIATQGEMSGRYHLYASCRQHWATLSSSIREAWPHWVARQGSSAYWQPPSSVARLIVDLRGRELSSYDYVFPIIEQVFRSEFLDKLHDPAVAFLEKVTDEVIAVVRQIAEKSFAGFVDIMEVVTENSNDEIAKVLEEARQDLLGRLFLQEARVFSQDSLFKLRIGKVEEALYKDRQGALASDPPPAPDSAERIRRGVQAYLEIATERMSDTIPQSVLYFMFDVVAKRLGNRVLELLSDSKEIFIGLLREDKFKTERRVLLQDRLEQLRLAQREFNHFRLEIG